MPLAEISLTKKTNSLLSRPVCNIPLIRVDYGTRYTVWETLEDFGVRRSVKRGTRVGASFRFRGCNAVRRRTCLKVGWCGLGDRLEVVVFSEAGCVYVVDGSRDVLRVVEDVEGVRAELDRVAIAERDALVCRQVNVVDGTGAETIKRDALVGVPFLSHLPKLRKQFWRIASRVRK